MGSKIFILFFSLFFANYLHAQDTAKQNIGSQNLLKTKPIPHKDSSRAISKKDSVSKFMHDPHKATIRSLIIPGWGQAYNHEYWKIPIVYAALAIPAVTFFYNNTWYKRTSYAFTVIVANDTANFQNIYPQLKQFALADDAIDLQNYRNEFRKDRDYSVLYFFIAWGLNVVDATVFGNLKGFDVSDNISMNVNPKYDPVSKTAGLGLVFNFKWPEKKIINLDR